MVGVHGTPSFFTRLSEAMVLFCHMTEEPLVETRPIKKKEIVQ